MSRSCWASSPLGFKQLCFLSRIERKGSLLYLPKDIIHKMIPGVSRKTVNPVASWFKLHIEDNMEDMTRGPVHVH